MKNERRAFLKTVGGVSALLAGTSADSQDRGEGGGDVSAAAMAGPLGGTRGFALDVDGASVGALNAYAGGTIGAEVITEAAGEDGVIRKHLGRLQYEDLSLRINSGFVKTPLLNWATDTLGRSFMRHDGAVHAYDFHSKEVRRTQFKDGLLTEVGFPSLDVSAKEAALFDFKVKPGHLDIKAGDGPVSVPLGKTKPAMRSNFRLTIDGLENAVKKVSKIDAFSVKMQVAYFGSEGCEPLAFEPGPLAIDDLVIRFSESAAKELYAWHEDFVMGGACGGKSKGERNGAIEFLAADFKQVLLRIELRGLGLHELSLESVAGGSDSLAHLVARMYCEEVALKA